MISCRSMNIAGVGMILIPCATFVSLCFYLSGVPLAVSGVLCVLLAVSGVILLLVSHKRAATAPKAAFSVKDITVRVTVTAVLLACVAVTKLFRLEIPMFGGAGMSVGFGGIFTAFPAMLYGPLYGGIATAISDILGTIISPIGAYNPLYTVTAFTGGFIKGCIWGALKDKKTKGLRLASLFAGILFAVCGIAFRVSLVFDGISSSYIASAQEMPSYGVTQQSDYSPLSRFVVSLASYNKDTYTISSVADAETFTVPAHIVADGESYVPKIGKKAFSNCPSLKTVYIPKGIKTIDENAFEGLSGVTVVCPEELIPKLKGVNGVAGDVTAEDISVEYGGSSIDAGGFTLTSNLSNSSYLAKYVNYLTVGLELAGFLMLLVVLGEYIYSRVRASRGKQKRTEECGFRIFVTLFTSGLITTTLNTFILRYITYPSWSARSFYIIWLPRVAEELIVCMLQAYLVTVLWDVYVNRVKNSRLQQKL